MRHTDVLLKVRTELAQDEASVEKARRDSADLLQSKLRLVQELGQSAGWAYFVSELKQERTKLFAMLERTTDPTTLAKVAGTLLAVESFTDWPEYMARELSAQVKDSQ